MAVRAGPAGRPLEKVQKAARASRLLRIDRVGRPYSPRLYGLLCLGIPGLAASSRKGQGAILAGVHDKGLPKGRLLCSVLVLLPSAAAVWGSVTPPGTGPGDGLSPGAVARAHPAGDRNGRPGTDRGKRRAYIGLFLPLKSLSPFLFPGKISVFPLPEKPFYPRIFGLSLSSDRKLTQEQSVLIRIFSRIFWAILVW